MKGYKAFNLDMSCRPGVRGCMKYEAGGTYAMKEPPVLCDRGFHFCKRAIDVFNWYYPNPDTRVCEVEALGEVFVSKDMMKCVTNRIRIGRELSVPEIKRIFVEAGEWPDRRRGIRRSIDYFIHCPRDYVLWAQYHHLQRCTDEDVDMMRRRADEWMQVLEEDEE